MGVRKRGRKTFEQRRRWALLDCDNPSCCPPGSRLVPDAADVPAVTAEFVGQERIKEQLGIALDAAKGRDEALDHVLSALPAAARAAAAGN